MQLDTKLAACANEDADMFFADDEESPNMTLIGLAKLVCALCPIKDLCLQKAIQEELDGIWGGTTTRERRILTNRKRISYIPIQRVVTENARKAGKESNMAKTIATVQRDSIILAKALNLFDDFDDLTKIIVKLRIENQDKSLADISEMISPPVSRDIVAGRIRRVKERIANAEN